MLDEGVLAPALSTDRGRRHCRHRSGVGAKTRWHFRVVLAKAAVSLPLLNGLTNVTALHLAMMDRPGKVSILESESIWSANTVARGGEAGVEVDASMFDEVCRELELEGIDFLKMRVQNGTP
jgi:hypothetical protein